jgi:hypothetical protein
MSDQNNWEGERKALTEEIVNRIASDEAFRTRIVDDPAGALADAGYAKRLEELSSDVSGYSQMAYGASLFSALSSVSAMGGNAGALKHEPVPPIYPKDPPQPVPPTTGMPKLPSTDPVDRGPVTQ